MEEDRISQLPEHILQNHILSFLPQINAVRTCILSKSWRYLGPTRPKMEFCKSFFKGSKEEFMFLVQNTLQRYVDQKLPIQEFVLEMWGLADDSQSISFLNKWIPILIKNIGVKTLKLLLADNMTVKRLSHLKAYPIPFALPSVVFQAGVLEELFLQGCSVDQISNSISGKLQVLKRLSLSSVRIEEETFEKIMSSCPLIEHLVLDICRGLSVVKVNKARNLKHFICCFLIDGNSIGSIEINDSPSLETIRIKNYRNWYHRNINNFFPRLKSLFLWHVHVPTKLLINLSSNNFPYLEELEIRYCSGFREFKLSNRSIKRLIINISDRTIEAVNIDAAKILYFELVVSNDLPSISFATTSTKWKSRIDQVLFSPDVFEILKALSQSQISLDISFLPLTFRDTYYGYNSEPVVVHRLCIKEHYSHSELQDYLNYLFRFFRPRYIGLPFSANTHKRYETQLAESVLKTLVSKGETRQQELTDKTTKERHHVRVCAMPNNKYIWFRLKWRDLS